MKKTDRQKVVSIYVQLLHLFRQDEHVLHHCVDENHYIQLKLNFDEKFYERR